MVLAIVLIGIDCRNLCEDSSDFLKLLRNPIDGLAKKGKLDFIHRYSEDGDRVTARSRTDPADWLAPLDAQDFLGKTT